MWKRFNKQVSQPMTMANATDDATTDHYSTPSESTDTYTLTESIDKTSPHRMRGMTEDRGALVNMLSAIRSSSKGFTESLALADAESERKVSQAAGRLGRDIQQIIILAKAGGQSPRPNEERKGGTDFESDAWKTRLLQVLGGTDIDVEQVGNPYANSDIDILLQNSTCDKFILRCLENELPPNLIHCLRLLRVLELQAAHSYARLQRNAKNSIKNTNSVSRSATDKVMQLLILLCKDIGVGDQLKPHLFGLLALPGASYPPNGMHIARAATEIIVAFSRFCLSPTLAIFLHERKVIMNMTDDVKELCGLIEGTNLTSGSLCLYGESAEEAGLWVVGLRAIIYLVYSSCSHRCVEILRDFYDAGGLDLLTFAIWNSRTNNVKKLLELVATLTYCKLETGLSRGENNNSSSNFLNELNKGPTTEKPSGEFGLATNPGAFQLIEDLMVRSVPLLKKYNEFYKSKIIIQKGSSVTELAKISLDISAELHVLSKMKDENENEVSRCNELASDLLVSTLQIYSDHPRNYNIIEDKYHVLALYLLSFTSFTDVSTKILILKTLEYVCTGLSDINPVIPIQITGEILLAMCKYHLRLSVDDKSIKSHEELLNRYSTDCSFILDVLEKLANMGPSVRDVLVAIGIFDEHFDEFSSTIMNSLSQDQQPIPIFNIPPMKTSFDEPFISICRLLTLSLHYAESESSEVIDGSLTLTGQSRDLNLLINAGVCEMGANAADAALTTLGTKMSYYTSISQLQIDMLFLMQLSIHFSELILRLPSVIQTQDDAVMIQLISRQCSIFKTFCSVLTKNRDAIHSFRIGLGFDIILRALGSLSRVASKSTDCCNSALQLIQLLFELLSVALTLKEYLAEGTSFEDYMGPSCDRDTYYEKFANSLSGTGMLSHHPYGELIVTCAFHVIDPSLILIKSEDVAIDEKSLQLKSAFEGSLRNPDAVSLILSIALRMPTDLNVSYDTINTVYSLCLLESSCSYGQIASVGLCRKLIDDISRVKYRHKLYHPLIRLFKKILSMRMNYTDFLWLVRQMIWPLFSNDGIRLSLPKTGSKDMLNVSDSDSDKLDQKLALFMECMSEIAEEGTRPAAMKLGGGSITSIAYEIQKGGRIEERLQLFAKEGGATFVQLNTAEPSSYSILSTQTLGANMVVTENLWSATSSTGFSYSLWIRVPYRSSYEGNMFLFDIATSPDDDSSRLSRNHYEYLSLFYDLKKDAFVIITSGSPKPMILCCIPLIAGWHHVLFTYQPAKRSVLSRKAQIGLVIDGRAMDADTKIDPVMLPSKSRIYIGVPNPILIISGIVSGPLQTWEMGSFILFSTVLSARDATSIYIFGPNYEGNFWGDSPQRLSLSSHATATFATFAIMKRMGGVLETLDDCGITDLESSSHASMENRFLGAYYEDSLSSLGLLFHVSPDAVMAACRLSSNETIAPYERCLHNLATINMSESTATDAHCFGIVSITLPQSLADNVRWGGGPSIFFPCVVSSNSIEQLIFSLRLIRSSIYRHVPNIDFMQACGGYRMLAYFLKEKNITDHRVIDECLGFATNIGLSDFSNQLEKRSDQLVLVDLEAMKSLLLNQHVWDLQRGPGVPLHLNARLNVLISPGAANSPFNARRMHQMGIVPFTLDLMLEAAKMYNLGYQGAEEMKKTEYRNNNLLNAISAFKNGWFVSPPSSTIVSAGGDPGNPLLFSCKNLLRRVLTYMLTPMDLENMAASAVYTLSIDYAPIGGDTMGNDMDMDYKLLPGSVTRIYLLRIIEELIIERIDSKGDNLEINRSEQTRAFLSAFSGILRPIWFTSLLDKCRDEASTSTVFRLLALMIQTCPPFLEAFIQEDSFQALRLTIPKFSTSPSIVLNLLGLLFHAPIWHLPCFATLQSAQLREVFESEWDDINLVNSEASVAGLTFPIARGALTLLLDCVVRNIRLSGLDDRLGLAAINVNGAALSVIEVCLKRSARFKDFSRTLGIYESLTSAICESIGAKKIRKANAARKRTETDPSTSPRNNVSLEGNRDTSRDFLESELRLVSIMRMIILELLVSKSTAASTIHALFRSYPPLASVDEVEGFHTILIESCISAVQECISNATLITFSNIVGLCSVLLERVRSGLFRDTDILECVSLSTFVLNGVLSMVPKTMGAMLNESNMLTTDTLHIVRLISLTALQRFRYSTITDPEMIPHQEKLSNMIISNLKNLLTPFPVLVTSTSKKMPPESSTYLIFQNASIIRSKTSNLRSLYPDVHAVEDPERTFILVLLAEENFLLLQNNKEIREIALPVILMLLRERRALMGELLRREYRKGENKSETIDLINRGGFGALLALIDSPMNSTDSSTPKLLNDAFFDWIDRNQSQVTPIFDSIRSEAYARLPFLESNIAHAADLVIEEEQRMVLDLQSPAEEEDVILRSGERSRYLQQIYEQCSEYLSIWKRSGFSDIICGEFLWEKYSLQIKNDLLFDPNASIHSCESKEAHGYSKIDRVTLDLSEGFERQRRRLLPNHRFKSLYNVLDKEFLFNSKEPVADISMEYKDEPYRPENDSVENVLQATAAILKAAKVSKSVNEDVSDFEINDGVDEVVIPISAFNQNSTVESNINADLNEQLPSDYSSVDKQDADKAEIGTTDHEDENAFDVRKTLDSSLELVMGFLVDGDKPEKVFNVKRCIGLEIRQAILLWCSRAIYVIDGFEMNQGEGLSGRINRVEQYRTTFNISLRRESNEEMANDSATNSESERFHDNADGKSKIQKFGQQTIFHHRAQRISFNDVHCIYRRRYQLRQVGLEFYDIHKTATLLAFDNQTKREEVLMSTLNARLPNSIFNSGIFGGTISLSYNKFMNNYRAKITNDWVSGKISNFDFLMHLNTFAGRSYNDLTQYPVFPWVLADYESTKIDLNDPSIYRDLSKPMGAIGESRAKQFKDRYDALEMHYLDQDEHEQPPPFHYGTHYSCAAYVVNYLIRLDPFTRLALTLQGGKFDLPDRLFQNVAASWRSASRDNLQDVRELIPEFFYLPDFLNNKNAFDYGVTQHGKVVHHVTLPPWAKGDPTRFVRIQRKALESDFVSRNLHKWIDLVFGYKQRGREAVESLNTFVHVTYEGAVDLDTIEDPVVRESTLAQIHNFGQTPSRLEKTPFPSRNVASILKEKNIDINATAYLSHLTPSYCIPGAPHKVSMKTASWDSCKLGLPGQKDTRVGDVYMSKGPILGAGANCIFVNSSTYIRCDAYSNSISFNVAMTSTRYREVDKVLSIIDDMHSSPITIARISSDAHFLITTCADSTVRVWRVNATSRNFERSYTLRLQGTLSGHEGVKVTCMDICSVFGTIVTGDANGVILLWTLRSLSFLRRLYTEDARSPSKVRVPAISVSLNHKNGNIVTLVGSSLKVFDINGIVVATLPQEFKFPMNNMPTCAISTNCQEWMDGIVAITGHMNGDVRMWSIDYERGLLVFRHVIPDKVHENAITCLRCQENQKNLLIGDSSGRISMASTMQLDSLSLSELAVVAEEIKMLSDVG